MAAREKYEVLHRTVGYRTAGNAHSFARRGEVIDLDSEQAKRHLGLGSIKRVENDAATSDAAAGQVVAPAESVVSSTVVRDAPESATAVVPETQPLGGVRDGSADPALLNAPSQEVTAPSSDAEAGTSEVPGDDTPMLNDEALASMSVAEVQEWVTDHPQHLTAVVDAERDGKGRKGILDLAG